MPIQGSSWHAEVLDPETRHVLRQLCRSSLLQEFYLGGGTGLALYLGHRRSADLDFFSSTGFRQDLLLRQLQGTADQLEVLSQDLETLHTHVNGAKVSFLGYRYDLLFPEARFEGVRVADPRDIACMKLSALSARGTRRDFIDLFTVAQIHELSELLVLFSKKFEKVNYNQLHLLKSLTYFADAEEDPSPELLIDLDWSSVKQFFERESLRLLTALA